MRNLIYLGVLFLFLYFIYQTREHYRYTEGYSFAYPNSLIEHGGNAMSNTMYLNNRCGCMKEYYEPLNELQRKMEIAQGMRPSTTPQSSQYVTLSEGSMTRDSLQNPSLIDLNRIDWAKLDDATYTKVISLLQQRYEAPNIKNLVPT